MLLGSKKGSIDLAVGRQGIGKGNVHTWLGDELELAR